MIKKFFSLLSDSLENNAEVLKEGRAFLPEFLAGKKLTRDIFPHVMGSLKSKLDMDMQSEFNNSMPKEYECGNFQRVDYVFFYNERLFIFFELESLDRSQLYLFFEHRDIKDRDNGNKLWYYYATTAKSYEGKEQAPKYFIFFLVLPDQVVKRYQIWDPDKSCRFIHPSLKPLIYQNPYRFYDNLIKSSARLFLQKELEFKEPKTDKWIKKKLVDFQDTCELVFITCTIKELILSRGTNLFDPKAETKIELTFKKT